MTDIVKRSVGKPLHLGVERDGKLIHLTATPENGKGITVDGADARPTAATSASRSTGHRAGRAAGRPVGRSFSTMWQVTDQEVDGHRRRPSRRAA